ncbi:MAG TPA: hypothetical protein VFV90_11430 [Usitatibacter sp.]|nr:hypothetical protein [Usitatibacter sp.]
MGLILFFGVGVGFLAAVMATFFIGRRAVAAMMPSPITPDGRRTILRAAVGGAVVGFVPALLLGTVIGATLGGNYGGAVATSASMRDAGALAGVVLGTFAVGTVLLCFCVVLGAWVGKWLAR